MAIIADLESILQPPAEIEAAVVSTDPNSWAERLKAAKSKARRRWNDRVGTPELWKNNLAGPSNKRYSDFVNPAFNKDDGETAGEIINKQGKKLEDVQPFGVDEFNRVMEDTNTLFEDNVDAAIQKFAQGFAATAAATGTGEETQTAPMPLHIDFWLNKDHTFNPSGNDQFQGNIDSDDLGYFFVESPRAQAGSAFAGIIIKAVVEALRGQDLTAVNSRLDALLTNLINDTDLDPAASVIEVTTNDEGLLILHSSAQTV